MFLDRTNLKVYLAKGITDLRKSYGSLSLIVEHGMKLDPYSGHLFLFCNRKRNLLKALYWDKNGYCLWQKRLDKDRFPWPRLSESGVLEISQEQLDWLLRGINFFDEHKNYFNSLTS